MKRVESRLFERGPHQSYAITCGLCGARSERRGQTMGGELADVKCREAFEREAWRVGRKPAEHRCPDCIKKGLVYAQKVVPSPYKEKAMPNTSAPLRPEPPLEMSKDDKRIIFVKLHEVYLDATKGYCDGWSDRKVADDLGVPRAWVADVRKADFGPDNSNDEARAIVGEALALAERMKADAAKLRAEGEAAIAKATELAARVEREAIERASALEVAAAALVKRVERIEKAF